MLTSNSHAHSSTFQGSRKRQALIQNERPTRPGPKRRVPCGISIYGEPLTIKSAPSFQTPPHPHIKIKMLTYWTLIEQHIHPIDIVGRETRTMNQVTRSALQKICATCGRQITWRKKWGVSHNSPFKVYCIISWLQSLAGKPQLIGDLGVQVRLSTPRLPQEHLSTHYLRKKFPSHNKFGFVET
jgi:hypothetical protein